VNNRKLIDGNTITFIALTKKVMNFTTSEQFIVTKHAGEPSSISRVPQAYIINPSKAKTYSGFRLEGLKVCDTLPYG
jgi:hypothetical protein